MARLIDVSLTRMQNYYIRKNGEVKGPYSVEQLRAMRRSGAFTKDTMFCAETSGDWHSLQQFVNYLDSMPSTEIQTAGKTWTNQKIWTVSAASVGLVVLLCGLPTLGMALIVAGGIGFIAAQYGGWGTGK